MGFLGVYKAVYDYEPQGASELAITEGDILYVLEKSGEDDWWKAKKKASGDDDDEPVGLIPNNYIEEVSPPQTHARALYDYTRQTDEELSFTEDAQLEVFDSSDPDWILVGLDGEYGFAPANYIELNDEETSAAEPPPPSLPRRPPQPRVEEEPESEPPSSPVHSPAANLANIMNQRKVSAPAARPAPAPPRQQFTPEASDEDEPPTPTLPARPGSQIQARAPESIDIHASRGSISPGIAASPPYNRASHRGIDDEMAYSSPGAYHMYNINEMVSVMGKRKKMPTTLGINSATGIIMIAPEKARDGPEQIWTAEKMTHYSIEGKHVFLELVRPSKSVDFHAGAKDTAHEIVSALGDIAGAVRAEGLKDIIMAGTGQSQKKGQVLYDFMAQGEDEVTVAVGDEVIVIDDTKSEEWWQVRRLRNGTEGVVPSSYIEITGTMPTPSTSGINAGRSLKDQNRLEEERLAKESLKAARREEDIPVRGSSLSAGDSSNNHGQQKNRRESSRPDQNPRASKSKPDPAKVRTWTDRSKSFSVEAQFLALKDGKINLHKMNGVKIAVPVVKMSVEDLEYVERMTGISLDEDKPLSNIKKNQRARADRSRDSASPVGASIERPKQPEYDWFQFFLSCDVQVGLCERYAQAFAKDSMDESVLPDIDAVVLRTLGLREGDIIKVMRFLDKKYARTGGKRSVSFGGEEVMDGESSGGMFAGPGGALRNNTRKGRPAPAVQSNDVVDPKAFSQEMKEKAHEGVATPLASVPTPTQKDVVRNGFDDDAWDVKPSKQQSQATASQPAQPVRPTAPAQVPGMSGSMQELSLLDQPLEPARAQPTPPQPQITQQTPQPQAQPQAQGPPPVVPSMFTGIGNLQTGLPPQQTGAPNNQFNPQGLQMGIPRPPPGQFQPQSQGGLMIPAPPIRPLSAPQANQQSGFSLPPLQAQTTGMQTSAGFQQPNIAPPGQSLNEMQMRQQFTAQNSMGMMNQPQNFNQFNNGGAPNGYQYPMPTGAPQQPFINNGISPFADPRSQQFTPIQNQPTGMQGPFQPQQQYPQPTGVNSFLPPALQPTPTGVQQPQNGFSSFIPPPIPPIPQQQTIAPLIPQKTGPPPPVRFGLTGDTKKLMPQATGRRANLSQATPQNPFGF
ncbi:Actin cytoskeleton-regulatory complex protein [Lachnellula occidentalis]|uniref:Actin cytoskeleton-regulatory complex protein SLA1 n=1 Tax=Lachnellula occidentalis TaxID=215460 RepID=A0A8H8UHW1_9HELO|nr:Actin cytoskeleton-regulatory complex protein [Lachnellula occidentalis]